MRRKKDTEKRVKNVKLAVNADANRKVFGHIAQAFDKSKARESAEHPPGACRRIAKPAIATLAAAAVIIVAIGFVIHRASREETDGQTASAAAKSPGEMLTVLSLNIAYRKGGMEAVGKQYDKAFKMFGPRPAQISIQELLAEFNGDWKGQKP